MPVLTYGGTGTGINATLNYATQYQRELSMNFPYVLNFGKLYSTPNNNRYRWINAKTIEIPSIRTTGRVQADRDTIHTATRNYDNAWESKTLTNERKWSTLVHPMDVDQTNMVASIGNITRTFNEFQKFPEMDAYTISKIYNDWISTYDPEDGVTLHRPMFGTLSETNILKAFDDMMLAMDNARVPANGRILYVTHEVNYILKNAQLSATQSINRNLEITSPNAIDRRVTRLDEVEIIPVPKQLMKTVYDFTEGWKVDSSAKQILMLLIDPMAVITPVSYTFSRLDPPSAGSEGKYVYYEESFEDVFILNKKSNAIQFYVDTEETLPSYTYSPVSAPVGNPQWNGYFEKTEDNKYFPTVDTVVVGDKTYYSRSEA